MLFLSFAIFPPSIRCLIDLCIRKICFSPQDTTFLEHFHLTHSVKLLLDFKLNKNPNLSVSVWFYVLSMLFVLVLNFLCISWGHNDISYEGVYGNENATTS